MGKILLKIMEFSWEIKLAYKETVVEICRILFIFFLWILMYSVHNPKIRSWFWAFVVCAELSSGAVGGSMGSEAVAVCFFSGAAAMDMVCWS